MLTKRRYQGLIFLALLIFSQCQNEENIQTKLNEFVQIGHHILQNGRIISKPVSIWIGIFIIGYVHFHQGCSTNANRSDSNA